MMSNHPYLKVKRHNLDLGPTGLDLGLIIFIFEKLIFRVGWYKQLTL
jgi:hypothetical protein